jgi:hypothetical protein
VTVLDRYRPIILSMAHVFISYARADAGYAERVDRDLKAHNFETWRDVRDLDESQDFTGEIEFAIRSSSHVIVCLTRDVQQRPDSFVRREIAYALQQDAKRREADPSSRLPLIPLVFPFGELPVLISTLTAIFVKRESDYPQQFEFLLERLRRPVHSGEEPNYLDSPELVAYLNALHDWVCTRLQQSVQALINLSSIDTPDAVAKKSARLFTFNFSVSPVLSGEVTDAAKPESPELAPAKPLIFPSFAEAFDHHRRRMLLLGPPGSGKTTTLLAFARDAAVARLNDSTRPVPLLASIRTWNGRTRLAEWAQSQTEGLGFAQYPLLYLLDGLDELGGKGLSATNVTKEGEDPRVMFMSDLETQLQSDPLVLTSRIADYEHVGRKLKIPGAVTIEPLTDQQIRQYLLSRSQAYLWNAVGADSALLAIARTPLLLCLLSIGYESDAAEGTPPIVSANEEQIFDRYIHRRFAHEESKYGPLPFDETKTRETLASLAVTMTTHFARTEGALDLNTIAKDLKDNAASFVEFGQRMHFLQKNAAGKIEFIHLSLRDYCAMPALLKILYAGRGWARRNAAWALGEIGKPVAVDVLTNALYSLRNASDEGSPYLTFLGQFGHMRNARRGWQFNDDSPGFLDTVGLTSPSSQPSRRDLCITLMQAIGKLGGSKYAVSVLADVLDSYDGGISGQAEATLVQIGTPEALEAVDEWHRKRSKF